MIWLNNILANIMPAMLVVDEIVTDGEMGAVGLRFLWPNFAVGLEIGDILEALWI